MDVRGTDLDGQGQSVLVGDQMDFQSGLAPVDRAGADVLAAAFGAEVDRVDRGPVLADGLGRAELVVDSCQQGLEAPAPRPGGEPFVEGRFRSAEGTPGTSAQAQPVLPL